MRKLLILCALIGCTPAQQGEPAAEPESKPAEAQPDAPVVQPPEAQPEASPSPSGRANADCLEIYSFGRDGSVLDEQRRRGGAARWDDFAERYPAATIDPARHHAVELVEGSKFEGRALLWFTPDFAGAVVDEAVFGDLEVVGATELTLGERAEIGTLRPAAQGKLTGRELVAFLMRARVIGTYIHIGSTMCLRAESSEADGSYRAELTGRHEYYTNEENIEAFAFVFELGADGAMAITGAEPTEFTTLVQLRQD